MSVVLFPAGGLVYVVPSASPDNPSDASWCLYEQAEGEDEPNLEGLFPNLIDASDAGRDLATRRRARFVVDHGVPTRNGGTP